jgi:hypothetical protein
MFIESKDIYLSSIYNISSIKSLTIFNIEFYSIKSLTIFNIEFYSLCKMISIKYIIQLKIKWINNVIINYNLINLIIIYDLNNKYLN